MTGWPAALLASLAAFSLFPAPGLARARLGHPPTSNGAPHRSLAALDRRRGLMLATVTFAIVALARLGPRLILLLAIALAASLVVLRLTAGARLRGARAARQRRVVALCDGLAAELRGGLPMTTAVRRCCASDPELAAVVSAAELGGDIAGALRLAARRPGAEGLRAVAAAWDVGGSSGAALASVLDRVARGLRDDADARAEVQAALGPPRATAKMLAALPVMGLALGASIGAHPVAFLLGTSWGLACLSAGVLLALLGLWWVERLATAAEV